MSETGERLARLEGAEPHMATKGDLIEARADFKAEMQEFRCYVERRFDEIAAALAGIQTALNAGVKVQDPRQLGFRLPEQGETPASAQRSQRGKSTV